MPGIDEAANAFQAVMDESGQPHQKPAPKGPARPTERMFDNTMADNSEDVAGGDELPAPGEVADEEEEAPPPRKKKEEPAEDQEESEGDEEGEEDDEDDNPENDEEDDSPRYRVMVEGEEKEVSLNEALDGYIRTETFHKRLNKLSEAQGELKKQYEGLTADRGKYAERLEDLEKTMKGLIPAEPDWDKEYEANPANARKLQKQYDGFKTQLESIRKEREAAVKEQNDADASALKNFATSELEKFFASDKKWSDSKELRKDLDAMRTTAFNLGFSEEEVAKVYDSRMLHVLLKASKYDRLMAKKPVPVVKGKQPVKPGTGSKGTVQRGITQAQRRLSRTGSIDDATEVFKNIISRR